MAYYPTNVLDNQIKALPTIATASGAVANFTTDKAERLVNCEVQIVAVQSGSGTPSPTNPRSISGFSACNIGHAKISTVVATGSKLNVSSSGEVLSVTQNYQYVVARVKQGVTYSYSINGTIATNCPVIAFFTDYPQVGSVSYNGSRGVSEYATFTAPIDGFVLVRGGNSYDEVNMMISVGSNVSEYEQPTTYNIPFGQTVYGGVLNVGTGVLRVTHGYVDLGTLTWAKTTWGNGSIFITNIPDCKNITDSSVVPNMICEQLSVVNADTIYGHNIDNAITYYASGLRAICDNCVDAPTFKIAMSGVYLIYELATPTTIQLDSTQIQTIANSENNIWADTGDISVQFILSVGSYVNQNV